MSPWLIAAVVGIAFALFQYGGRDFRVAPSALLAALLRVIAVTLIVALILDAPAGRAKPLPTWVALDASASWLRAGDSTAWKEAVRATRAARPESLFLFGDSLRVVPPLDSLRRPGDLASLARPALERALGRGHPLYIITDGELADAEALRELPAGSRVSVMPHAASRDLAVASLEMPRALVSGDSVEVRVGLLAGALGASPATLTLSAGNAVVAQTPIDSLGAYAERAITMRARVEGREGPTLVRAVVTSRGDAEPRNDTLSVGVDLSRAASAVFVSTSPNFDARYALSVLRGALAVPARGYFKVAPGAWRVDGSLTAVTEADVRQAFHDAPVAILQGDTAVFGPPRSATSGPLALVLNGAGDEGEWYAVAAPPSPLGAALSGLPWDSLPPVSVSAAPPTGQWKALEARRGRENEHRVLVAGSDTPRRVVIVAASGLWRWRFRPGTSADAFTALWGSIFDWLATERADRRAAIPVGSVVRAGEPVRWHRGSAADSSVLVVLRRLGAGKDSTRVDSLALRFRSDATITESPSLPAGLYTAEVRGGNSLLVVNPSREFLPMAPRIKSGATGGSAPLDTAPRLRTLGWVYALLLGSLCGEWVLRRRKGMR